MRHDGRPEDDRRYHALPLGISSHEKSSSFKRAIQSWARKRRFPNRRKKRWRLSRKRGSRSPSPSRHPRARNNDRCPSRGMLASPPVRRLRAQPLMVFPTENQALLEGRPQDFFMYVNRDFEGEKSKPWQGGQFGFVRGPIRNGDKVTCIQFHEGIDIRPVHRDAEGNPTDEVRAAGAGAVVHVSREAAPQTTEVMSSSSTNLMVPPSTRSTHISPPFLSSRASPCVRVMLSASWDSQEPASIESGLTPTLRFA